MCAATEEMTPYLERSDGAIICVCCGEEMSRVLGDAGGPAAGCWVFLSECEKDCPNYLLEFINP